MAIAYNSNYDLTIPFSDVCAQIALNANTDLTYTVPGDATIKYSARISMTTISSVFVGLNAIPVIPGAGTVGTQPFNEFRCGGEGSQRYVQGGDVLHFITGSAGPTYVGVSLRQLS
jgi:hypothetical protein